MTSQIEQKPLAFVLMPFDKELSAVYQQIIVPALESAGYIVERADSVASQQNILKDIVKGIASASLIVADLTTMNPNVMYEVGIAHAKEKPTLLLTQDIEEVPFDLRSYRMIVYSTQFDEIQELTKSIRSVAERTLRNEIEYGSPVSDYWTQDVGNKSNLKKITDEDDMAASFGRFDFAVKAIPISNQYNEALVRTSTLLNGFSSKIKAKTNEINLIVEANKGQEGIMAKVYPVIETLASFVDEFSVELGNSLNDYKSAQSEYVEFFEALLNQAEVHGADEIAAAKEALLSNSQLRDTVALAMSEIAGFKTSLLAAKSISRSIGRAVTRVARVLSAFISEFEQMLSFSARIENLINDKLNK